MGKNVGGNAVNITGSGTNGIKNEIRNGNPVVTWITYNYASPQFKQMPWGRAVWNGHVVLVDGFKMVHTMLLTLYLAQNGSMQARMREHLM